MAAQSFLMTDSVRTCLGGEKLTFLENLLVDFKYLLVDFKYLLVDRTTVRFSLGLLRVPQTAI